MLAFSPPKKEKKEKGEPSLLHTKEDSDAVRNDPRKKKKTEIPSPGKRGCGLKKRGKKKSHVHLVHQEKRVEGMAVPFLSIRCANFKEPQHRKEKKAVYTHRKRGHVSVASSRQKTEEGEETHKEGAT